MVAQDQALLRSRDAADFIAVCERTLFGLAKDNKIPTVRIGRSVRFSRADLLKFIEARRSK